MASVRSKLSGTLRKDGRWQLVVTLTDFNGGKIRKTLYGSTQREVQAKARDLLNGGRSTPVSTKLNTLLDIVRREKWATLEDKTVRSYEWAAVRISARFGEEKINDITRPAVSNWLKYESKQLRPDGKPKLMGNSLRTLRSVIHGIFEYAQDLGLMTSNPAAGVANPVKAVAVPQEPFTHGELQKIFEAERNETFRLLWQTLAESGVRPFKEGLWLERKHLLYRFDQFWLYIEKSKTQAGKNRLVPIPGDLGAKLMDRQGYLFASKTGQPASDRNISRAFEATCKRAGVPYRSIYALRDYGLSQWIAQGLPDDIVQTLAGHTDIRLTKNLYNKVSAERLSEAVWEGSYVKKYVSLLSEGPESGDYGPF